MTTYTARITIQQVLTVSELNSISGFANTLKSKIQNALRNYGVTSISTVFVDSQTTFGGYHLARFRTDVTFTTTASVAKTLLMQILVRGLPSEYLNIEIVRYENNAVWGSPTTPTNTTNAMVNYTVQSGDTLSKIAQRFNTTWKAIQIANANRYPSLLINPNVIEIGWVLVIPNANVNSGGGVINTDGNNPTNPDNTPVPTNESFLTSIEKAIGKSGMIVVGLGLVAVIGVITTNDKRR